MSKKIRTLSAGFLLSLGAVLAYAQTVTPIEPDRQGMDALSGQLSQDRGVVRRYRPEGYGNQGLGMGGAGASANTESPGLPAWRAYMAGHPVPGYEGPANTSNALSNNSNHSSAAVAGWNSIKEPKVRIVSAERVKGRILLTVETNVSMLGVGDQLLNFDRPGVYVVEIADSTAKAVPKK